MSFLEPEGLVRAEIAQRREEGCDTSEVEGKLYRMREKSPRRLEALLEELDALSPRPDFPYSEPSDLPRIRAERPSGPREMEVSLSEEELYDRVYGAWLGRCAGCLLGKPVEGWSREKIERYLRLAGA